MYNKIANYLFEFALKNSKLNENEKKLLKKLRGYNIVSTSLFLFDK